MSWPDLIIHKFPCGPLQTNTILIGCSRERKAAIVDPAYRSTQVVLQKCLELELQIDRILLTHSHWDHIADVYDLAQKTAASIYVHSLDAPNLEHPGIDGLPSMLQIRGITPDHVLVDNERIFIGDVECTALHTPGHSPGSVCYYIPTHKVLFSGDTLFEMSMGAIHLPTSEPEKMWDSLDLLSLLPPDTRVVPGHGRDTLIGNESWLAHAREFFAEESGRE